MLSAKRVKRSMASAFRFSQTYKGILPIFRQQMTQTDTSRKNPIHLQTNTPLLLKTVHKILWVLVVDLGYNLRLTA
ncbi:MAG: hypothetical protein CSYNP_03685 [Syntrophus sp. SKADARSKE-3]|nr:hypothetical protein [Syntrophus sp. SKADARSKE-3]